VIILVILFLNGLPAISPGFSSSAQGWQTSPGGGSSSQQLGGGLDCRGDSPISKNPAPIPLPCPDFLGANGSKPYDNGQYVGADEATVQFLSGANRSADNFQWAVTLPKDPVPTQNGSKVASFELYDTFWFSIALCDPYSYPQNPCTPDSDGNVGGPAPGSVNSAGSATLEWQFYPPPSPYCLSSSGAPITEWCAIVNIFSSESTYNQGYVNPDCTEPVNAAQLTLNGIPSGPVAPGTLTLSTYETNSETLLMNGGDRLIVTINDTADGLYTGAQDLTTGQTGYMVASAANGFAHTNIKTCQTTPYSFHPEFSTATSTHVSPWTLDSYNVDFAFEVGHFLLDTPTCIMGSGNGCPHDVSPSNCYHITAPVAGCVISQDLDFTGLSYKPDWPNGSASFPTPLIISSPSGTGIGPVSWDGRAYSNPYTSMLFTTIVAVEEKDCGYSNPSGCVFPPAQNASEKATFYPFYSQSGKGNSCTLAFGNDIPGNTTNDFGKDIEFGTSLSSYPFTYQSPVFANPCVPVSPLVMALSSSAIGAGGSVTASSTLIRFNSGAGGTVAYDYFSGSACSGSPTSVGSPLNVTNGMVPSSSSKTFSTVGSYSWNAVYSGDKDNDGATSECVLLNVYNAPLLSFTATCSHPSLVVGSTTTCQAKVEGSSSVPTGSVAWSSSSPGKFSKVACTLTKGACSVKFTPTFAGSSVMVTASYQRPLSEPPYWGSSALDVTAKSSKTTVSCAPKSVAVTSKFICKAKVTGYSPTGTVSLSLNGNALFSSLSCVLAHGTCSVRDYVTESGTVGAGVITIIASYLGDSNNQISSGTATVATKA